MKCEPDCQWTYTGGDGKPWHCECGAVDLALQMAAATGQADEGRSPVGNGCDTDCPTEQEAIRIVIDLAALLKTVADAQPTAESWAELERLAARGAAVSAANPCPYCGNARATSTKGESCSPFSSP